MYTFKGAAGGWVIVNDHNGMKKNEGPIHTSGSDFSPNENDLGISDGLVSPDVTCGLIDETSSSTR